MNTTKLNEWLQIAASIGVLIGLLIVAYEIRQNTSVAEAEHSRALYTMWLDLSSAEMESDVGRSLIAAIENPKRLTTEDKFRINSWLTAVVSINDYVSRAIDLEIAPSWAAMQEGDARYYFASEYARKWFAVNRSWIRPAVAETISRAIDEALLPTTWDESIGISVEVTEE